MGARSGSIHLACLTVLIAATSCSARQTPPAATQPAPADTTPVVVPADVSTVDPTTNDLLDRMHTLGETLTSLRANIDMTTEDAITGVPSSRLGTFLLQRHADGDSRAHVLFEKLIVDDGVKPRIIPEKVEYLLEGDWVTDRVYGRGDSDPSGKRETRRQIRKPGQKVDLLKLGEGPFPLPIGQPRDSVCAQFEVTRLPDDPEKPGLIGLELRPREETRLARRFHQIILWVDAKDAMPRIIETINAETQFVPDPQNPGTSKPELVAGAESKKTTLSEVKINEPVTDADFKLPPIDEGKWSIVTEAYKE